MKQLNEYENGTQALVYINGINGLCFVTMQSKTFSGHVFLESVNSMDPNFSPGSVIPVEVRELRTIEIFTQDLKDHGINTISQKESHKEDFSERDEENRNKKKEPKKTGNIDSEIRFNILQALPELLGEKIVIVQQPIYLAFDLIGENGQIILRLHFSDIKRIGNLSTLLSKTPYDATAIIDVIRKWCIETDL